jgi:hypothetical protein
MVRFYADSLSFFTILGLVIVASTHVWLSGSSPPSYDPRLARMCATDETGFVRGAVIQLEHANDVVFGTKVVPIDETSGAGACDRYGVRTLEVWMEEREPSGMFQQVTRTVSLPVTNQSSGWLTGTSPLTATTYRCGGLNPPPTPIMAVRMGWAGVRHGMPDTTNSRVRVKRVSGRFCG